MEEKLLVKRWIALFSIAIAILFATVVATGKAMPDGRTQSGDESSRQSRNEEVRQLLMIVRDDSLRLSDPDRVVQAINRFGQLKSTEAISDLIRLLTFKRVFESERLGLEGVEEIHLITPSVRYPATGALVEIGQPSLPNLIGVIEAHDSSSLETENARYAVMAIFRDNPALAVQHLRKAQAEASSPQAADRLSNAVDKVAEIVKKLTEQ
ncbi:MAG TPA: hypothetical protein VNS63_05585 [Blastocatellia bacterium]|nr:hypothetical protein [Blastocatellia bacterium]